MNIKQLILFSCIASILLSACKKELDQKPTDFFSDENAFVTMQDAQFGVNGAYARYSAYANDMYVNALLSDEASLGSGNAGQGALTYRYQYASDGTTGGDVIAAYGAYYSLIDQVNRVLAKVPTVKAAAVEEPRRKILTGQLLALRAIAHFSLLEFYADRYDASKPGVPIMLESCVTCKPARNTMGEVMAQIEKDLSDAKGLLAGTAASFTDTVMNEVNIAGYQARISLYKKDYQKAIDYATEVINRGASIPNLNLASAANFPYIWTDESTAEVLFRVRYSTGSTIGSLWTTTGGDVYVAPSQKLAMSYDNSDIRKDTYIGGTGGDLYVNKFFQSPKGGRVVDIKAMRIAEMYLIRAEAYAKLGNVTDGSTDLNAVRTKRSAANAGETFANADTLFNAVMQERFKELCFEGFRFFDLKRNFLPVQRDPADANPQWQTLEVTNTRWTMPIPRDEIQVNPNVSQNPGY